MTKRYYESHITIEGEPDAVRPHVEATGWKFSAIVGDIVLGAGVKCYATKHYNTRIGDQQAVDVLNYTADWLERAGLKVIRRKVELVLYDDRSSKVRPCNGGCVECHLDDLKTQEA